MDSSLSVLRIAIQSFLAIISFVLAPGLAQADTEGVNRPYVRAGEPDGSCYARAVPHDGYLQKGVTEIYEVTASSKDRLLHRFKWYSSNIHLRCAASATTQGNVSVVRLGKWPRGRLANDKELAIGFYNGGDMVASYSTLDIAGSPYNVRASVSHYRVIRKVIGFGYSDNFKVITADGRILNFDTKTGFLRNSGDHTLRFGPIPKKVDVTSIF